MNAEPNADEIVKALRYCGAPDTECGTRCPNSAAWFKHFNCSGNLMRQAADLIESLQAQLTASQRREKAAVEDLEKYAHNGYTCGTKNCYISRLDDSPCYDCPHWEWRGPQDEEGEANG